MSFITATPEADNALPLVSFQGSEAVTHGNLRGLPVQVSPKSSEMHELLYQPSQSRALVPLADRQVLTKSSICNRILNAKCRMLDQSNHFISSLSSEIEEQSELTKERTKELDEKYAERRIQLGRAHSWSTFGSVFESAGLLSLVAAGIASGGALGVGLATYGAGSLLYKAVKGTGMIPNSPDLKDDSNSVEDKLNTIVPITDKVATTSSTILQYFPSIQALAPAAFTQAIQNAPLLGRFSQTLGTGYTFLHGAVNSAMGYAPIANTAAALGKYGISPLKITGLTLITTIAQAGAKIAQSHAMSSTEILTADCTLMEGELANMTLTTDEIFAKMKQQQGRFMRNQELFAEMYESIDACNKAICNDMKI